MYLPTTDFSGSQESRTSWI